MTVDRLVWPTSWRSVPLWSLFHRVKDVGHPDEEMLSVYRDHGVVRKESRADNFNKTAENRNIYQLVDVGWLIINRMKAWQGSLGISPYRGIVSGHYICFRPEHTEDDRFLNYLLRSAAYTAEFRRLSRGVRPNQIEIDNDGLRVLPVRLPGSRTQRLIADYLDAEMARIDSFVAKKLRMIELLDERSQRVVAEQFGDGLIYSVDGRPIGIEGVRCVRLGVVAKVQSGLTVDEGREGGPEAIRRPYLRVANVQDGSLDLTEIKEVTVSPALAARCTLQSGDVLMTEGGDPDKLGRGAVWPGTVAPCLHQNHVFAVRPRPELLPEYLALVTRTPYARAYFEMTASKTTGIASTSTTKIASFRVPLPSLEEQRLIVDWVARRLADIDAVRRRVEAQVNLIIEHRQALITAAVSGDLEVPEAAA